MIIRCSKKIEGHRSEKSSGVVDGQKYSSMFYMKCSLTIYGTRLINIIIAKVIIFAIIATITLLVMVFIRAPANHSR